MSWKKNISIARRYIATLAIAVVLCGFGLILNKIGIESAKFDNVALDPAAEIKDLSSIVKDSTTVEEVEKLPDIESDEATSEDDSESTDAEKEPVFKKVFLTVFDKDGKVMSTNDPSSEAAYGYGYDAEGNPKFTIKPEDKVFVRIRIPEIVDGNLLDENVVYALDLPELFTPTYKEDAETSFLNPSKPIVFLDNGRMKAEGGIYMADENAKPQLQIRFKDTADETDASLELVYSAIVNPLATPATTYSVGVLDSEPLVFETYSTAFASNEDEQTSIKIKRYSYNSKSELDSSNRVYRGSELFDVVAASKDEHSLAGSVIDIELTDLYVPIDDIFERNMMPGFGVEICNQKNTPILDAAKYTITCDDGTVFNFAPTEDNLADDLYFKRVKTFSVKIPSGDSPVEEFKFRVPLDSEKLPGKISYSATAKITDAVTGKELTSKESGDGAYGYTYLDSITIGLIGEDSMLKDDTIATYYSISGNSVFGSNFYITNDRKDGYGVYTQDSLYVPRMKDLFPVEGADDPETIMDGFRTVRIVYDESINHYRFENEEDMRNLSAYVIETALDWMLSADTLSTKGHVPVVYAWIRDSDNSLLVQNPSNHWMLKRITWPYFEDTSAYELEFRIYSGFDANRPRLRFYKERVFQVGSQAQPFAYDAEWYGTRKDNSKSITWEFTNGNRDTHKQYVLDSRGLSPNSVAVEAPYDSFKQTTNLTGRWVNDEIIEWDYVFNFNEADGKNKIELYTNFPVLLGDYTFQDNDFIHTTKNANALDYDNGRTTYNGKISGLEAELGGAPKAIPSVKCIAGDKYSDYICTQDYNAAFLSIKAGHQVPENQSKTIPKIQSDMYETFGGTAYRVDLAELDFVGNKGDKKHFNHIKFYTRIDWAKVGNISSKKPFTAVVSNTITDSSDKRRFVGSAIETMTRFNPASKSVSEENDDGIRTVNSELTASSIKPTYLALGGSYIMNCAGTNDSCSYGFGSGRRVATQNGITSIHEELVPGSEKAGEDDIVRLIAKHTKLVDFAVYDPNSDRNICTIGESQIKYSEMYGSSYPLSQLFGYGSCTLKYGGNMENGFDVQFEILANSNAYTSGTTPISDANITYHTSFDEAAFLEELHETLGLDYVNTYIESRTILRDAQGNQLGTSNVKAGYSVSATRHISIEKHVYETARNNTNGGYDGKYGIDLILNGGGADTKILVSDYLTRFEGRNGYESKPEALNYLADGLEVRNLSIVAKPASSNQGVVLFRDGEFTEACPGCAVNYRGQNTDFAHPGTLFELVLTPFVNGDKTKIEIRYDTHLDIDTNDFRQSEYYLSGGLPIDNGASVSVPTGSVTLLPDESETVKIKTGAAGVCPDCPVVEVMTDGDVESIYLTSPMVIKNYKMEGGKYRPELTPWTMGFYTGTMGRRENGNITVDSLTVQPNETAIFKDSDLSEERREEIIDAIRRISIKHTRFENLKFFSGADSFNRETELIWEVGTPDEGEISYKWDGRDIKFTFINQTYFKRFDFVVTPRLIDSYYQFTYDVRMDMDAIFEELIEEGIINDDHIVIGTNNLVEYNVENSGGGDADNMHKVTSNSIQFSSSTASVVKEDDSSYSIRWKATYTPGFTTRPNDKFRIDSTKIILSTEDEEILEIFDKDTILSDIAIEIENVGFVYENGSYTGVAEDIGFSDENIKFDVNERIIDFELMNTDKFKAVDPGKKYIIHYTESIDIDESYAKNEPENAVFNSAQFVSTVLTGNEYEEQLAKSSYYVFYENSLSAEKKYGFVTETDTMSRKWTIDIVNNSEEHEYISIDDTLEPDGYTSSEDSAFIESSIAKDFEVLAVSVDEEGAENETPVDYRIVDAEGNEIEAPVYGGKFILQITSPQPKQKYRVRYITSIDLDKYYGDPKTAQSAASRWYINRASITVPESKYVTKTSRSGSIYIRKPIYKESKSNKIVDGHKEIDWSIRADLSILFDEETLAEQDEFTVVDELSPLAELDPESIVVKGLRCSVTSCSETDEIPFEFNQVGRLAKITIKNPSENSNVSIRLKTTLKGAADTVSNNAYIEFGGDKPWSDTASSTPSSAGDAEYGLIQSRSAAKLRIDGYKYLNGELSSIPFEFTLVEVDANNEPIDGGLELVVENDENGYIDFGEFSYSDKTATSHYYRVTETSVVEPYTYELDDREFIVRVDVSSGPDEYVAAKSIVSPENFDAIRFDNSEITMREFSVTKIWDDEEDKAGARPEKIFMKVQNHGEDYDDMIAELNEENGWTYVWELPLADAEYSVLELETQNYIADYELSEDGWSAVVTNTYVAPPAEDVSVNPFTSNDKVVAYVVVMSLSLGASVIIRKRAHSR